MSARTLRKIGLLIALVAVSPAAANAQAPESQEVTVTGTVIDLDCKFRAGQSGAGHRQCAQVCADNGLTLAILGDDGKLYMPVGGGMPGQPQNPRLREFAEQSVTVRGRAYQAGGAVALEIESIRRT
jgi:hypothetical protein